MNSEHRTVIIGAIYQGLRRWNPAKTTFGEGNSAKRRWYIRPEAEELSPSGTAVVYVCTVWARNQHGRPIYKHSRRLFSDELPAQLVAAPFHGQKKPTIGQ